MEKTFSTSSAALLLNLFLDYLSQSSERWLLQNMWHTVYSAHFPNRGTDGSCNIQTNWISGNVSHLLITGRCFDPQHRLLIVFVLRLIKGIELKNLTDFFLWHRSFTARNTSCFYLRCVCSAWHGRVMGTDDRFMIVYIIDSAPIECCQSQWGLYMQWVRQWPFQMDFKWWYCLFYHLPRWKIIFHYLD